MRRSSGTIAVTLSGLLDAYVIATHPRRARWLTGAYCARRAVEGAVRGLALLSLLPGLAQAHDLAAELSVEQGAGADQCADRAALEQRVQRAFCIVR